MINPLSYTALVDISFYRLVLAFHYHGGLCPAVAKAMAGRLGSMKYFACPKYLN
jgi:hypothetical protein